MTQEHGPAGAQPNEEELRRALQEEMRRIRVEDVIVQTAVTLVNLAGDRLGLTGPGAQVDVGQAKLAIEGARALLPLLPDEAQAPVRDALSQIQIAYAQAAGGEAPAAGGPEPGGPEAAGEQPAPGEAPQRPTPEESAAEAERAKARSKIWTPPGA